MNILLLNKDLRIKNNLALKTISKSSNDFYVFYFLQSKHLKINAIPSINYLKNRLNLLLQKININVFEVNDEIKFLQSIHDQNKITSIYINECFTPFAINRQEKLENFCKKNDIKFIICFDYLNFKPGTITTTNGSISKTFAPFRQVFLSKFNELKLLNSFAIKPPKVFKHKNKVNHLLFKKITTFPITHKQVMESIKRQVDYAKRRDQLADLNFPSKISTAIGWGVVAFTEIILYAAKLFGSESDFVRQLIFREFYYHYYVFNRNQYIISSKKRSNILWQYDTYPWINDAKDQSFQAWKNAQTGVKLVDAAMNELNTTFNMKNRMRMVVASFLTKDLNIHWRLGERYFAKLLTDYDPVINNQSWQWAAGSGLDYRGASRIFSIARQQEKHDPYGFYIDHFLPKKHVKMLEYDPKAAYHNWRKRRSDWAEKNKYGNNLLMSK